MTGWKPIPRHGPVDSRSLSKIIYIIERLMNPILLGTLSLLIGAALSVLIPRNRVQVWVNLASQLIACVLVVSVTAPILMGGESFVRVLPWSYPVESIRIEINAISAFFLTFSMPMTFLGSLFAVGYLAKDMTGPRHVGIHFALLSMVQLSYVIIYSVQNAFAFLVGWEIAALSAWLLVIYEHRNQKIRFAGFNYLISTHVGLLFLVAAITVIHASTHSFQFADFATFFSKPSPTRGLAFVLLLTSFCLKSAFYPFHTWLPRAHAAAPAHVSALMSGVIHKAGLFGMLKFLFMIGEPELWMGWLIIAISAISAFMGILYTITQRDLKRLLGYSSTENVGIAGIGFGIGSLGLSIHDPVLAGLGFGGGILHILNHALFKCLLFYGAGSVYRFTHAVDLEKLGGLLKPMKWTGALFLLGSLASAALPPFNAFVSEFLLYVGLLHFSPELGLGRFVLPLFAAILAIVGGLSALSITRAFGLTFLGVARDPKHAGAHSHENIFMLIPMVIHGIGILLVGLFPLYALQIIAAPVSVMLRLDGQVASPIGGIAAIELIQSLSQVAWVLVAVIAILLVLRFALLPVAERKHVTWGCGYTAPNTRMQYTGSSFSGPMIDVFRDFLRFFKRGELPQGVFPKDGSYETHCMDSVERRMFGLLNGGDSLAKKLLPLLSEESRFSFALGLVGLIAIGVFVAMS